MCCCSEGNSFFAIAKSGSFIERRGKRATPQGIGLNKKAVYSQDEFAPFRQVDALGVFVVMHRLCASHSLETGWSIKYNEIQSSGKMSSTFSSENSTNNGTARMETEGGIPVFPHTQESRGVRGDEKGGWRGATVQKLMKSSKSSIEFGEKGALSRINISKRGSVFLLFLPSRSLSLYLYSGGCVHSFNCMKEEAQ